MSINEDIHKFALKYYNMYTNPNAKEEDFFDGRKFIDECLELNFKMDCGESFIEKYSAEIFNEVEEFEKIIEEIADIKLLGSAIFSKWRYVTHWSYNESLLDENNRRWFILAFNRLAELTA
ncbi:MAG: hypothetical protein IJ728_12620 [Selenomonadaceae bacterium]|nr:hypothetical protein [Selenomonadaceae bacterium]